MANDTSKPHVLSYLIKNIMHFPGAVIMTVLAACMSAAHTSLSPYLIKIIINTLMIHSTGNEVTYLLGPIIAYLGMYLTVSIVHRLCDYVVEVRTIPHLRNRVTLQALALLMHKTHPYYQNNLSSNLVNKVTNLLYSVPDVLQFCLYQFLAQTMAVSIAFITLCSVHTIFALAILSWVGMFLGTTLWYAAYFAHLAEQWAESGSMLSGKMGDLLSNNMAIRLFTAQGHEEKLFTTSFGQAITAEQKLKKAYGLLWLLYGISFFVLQVFNFYFLCKGRQAGWISVSDFAFVLTINTAVGNNLWKIAEEFIRFSNLYGRIAQALRTIGSTQTCYDAVGTPKLVVSHGALNFSHLTFGYSPSNLIFENLCLSIPAGQKVGLVGYSGAGKTTLVNLLLRLYPLTHGSIAIDGQDINEVTYESLYNAIGVISQEPILFDRTLMENIRYGRLNASDQEVIQAAQRAYAHDFIMALPQGYDSLVGERGIKLSGGQRQRIAIARAILKDAPILIIDEATSQLDSLTEGDIQKSLLSLMQSRTTIVIAHRLSTLLAMDRIIVLQHGAVVEDGTHAELLAVGHLYTALWTAQRDGFLTELTL